MTGEQLDYLILQHTGLTAEQHPEAYGKAYRLAFAVMAATYEECQPETRKDLPSPAANVATWGERMSKSGKRECASLALECMQAEINELRSLLGDGQ
jgi:hypothetical protein